MTLPHSMLDTRSERVSDEAALDTAAGASLTWTCINLSDEHDSWLVVGARANAPSEALFALRSVATQLIMALRSSEVHQELTVLGRVDSLTGLANRGWFVRELSRHLADRRHHPGMHVLFLDLDDFKDVNDVLGHRAGDAVLIEVAARLRRCTRSMVLCDAPGWG